MKYVVVEEFLEVCKDVVYIVIIFWLGIIFVSILLNK